MKRNPRCLVRVVLTALSVLSVAALVQAGPAPAGNGKGDGAGHGKPTEELLLLNKRGQTARIEYEGGASSAVAPERANERGMPGPARSYGDAVLAERETQAELGQKRDLLAVPGAERTAETIQAGIDAPDPAWRARPELALHL